MRRILTTCVLLLGCHLSEAAIVDQDWQTVGDGADLCTGWAQYAHVGQSLHLGCECGGHALLHLILCKSYRCRARFGCSCREASGCWCCPDRCSQHSH